MGIQDRDYYRETLPRGGFGYFNAWSITTWLIVINVAVFFVDAALFRAANGPPRDPWADEEPPELVQSTPPRDSRAQREAAMLASMGPLQRWGYFSTAKAIYAGQVWRFITFQFLHASPMHLIFNMIGIYFFGPIVEARFGPRRYMFFYLICGLGGAACYLLLSFAHILVMDPAVPLVGASAGIFGLLVAAAHIAPDVQVFYYLFPVTIGMMALFGMLAALYSVISLGHNAGGEAAHLGGGIVGFAIMKNQHWLNAFAPARRETVSAVATRGRRRKRRMFQKDWSKDLNR
jgi:membrane associated rhomboid family serine protease